MAEVNKILNFVLEGVTLSYPDILVPKEDDKGTPKYSVKLIIPKEENKQNLQKLLAAKEEVFKTQSHLFKGIEAAKDVTWYVYDGDGKKTNGKPFGEECKNAYVLTVRSNFAPPVITKYAAEVTKDKNADEVYPGVKANVYVNAYGYNHEKSGPGITFGLGAVQVLGEGERIGGGVVDATSVFDVETPDLESMASQESAEVDPITGLPKR